MVSLDDLLAAREVISGHIHRTPVFSSTALGRELGARAFLKAELFQRTGSFKPRGVLNRLAALTPEERARGIVTWSAGNHAQAVAWVAGTESIDCLVVMSAGANPAPVAGWAVRTSGGRDLPDGLPRPAPSGKTSPI